jgi:hypothetical protein
MKNNVPLLKRIRENRLFKARCRVIIDLPGG